MKADDLRKVLAGEISEEETPDKAAPEPDRKVETSRTGKKVIMGHFTKNTHQQLKFISVEQETDIQTLLAEALNLLFEKYDKPRIAQ